MAEGPAPALTQRGHALLHSFWNQTPVWGPGGPGVAVMESSAAETQKGTWAAPADSAARKGQELAETFRLAFPVHTMCVQSHMSPEAVSQIPFQRDEPSSTTQVTKERQRRASAHLQSPSPSQAVSSPHFRK